MILIVQYKDGLKVHFVAGNLLSSETVAEFFDCEKYAQGPWNYIAVMLAEMGQKLVNL